MREWANNVQFLLLLNIDSTCVLRNVCQTQILVFFLQRLTCLIQGAITQWDYTVVCVCVYVFLLMPHSEDQYTYSLAKWGHFIESPFQRAVWVDLDLRVKLDLCWGLGLGIKMAMAGVRGWSGLTNIGIQTFFSVFVCVWDKDHLCGAGTEWIWSVPCHLALDLSLWPSTLADHTRYSPSLSAFPFSSFFLDTVYPRVHLQASTVHTETHVCARTHTHILVLLPLWDIMHCPALCCNLSPNLTPT